MNKMEVTMVNSINNHSIDTANVQQRDDLSSDIEKIDDMVSLKMSDSDAEIKKYINEYMIKDFINKMYSDDNDSDISMSHYQQEW